MRRTHWLKMWKWKSLMLAMYCKHQPMPSSQHNKMILEAVMLYQCQTMRQPNQLRALKRPDQRET